MSTKTPKKSKISHKEIQKNVVRMALIIFFVATVSAAGGFLQGQKVAVEGGNQIASSHNPFQRINFGNLLSQNSLGGPLVNGITSFLGNKLQQNPLVNSFKQNTQNIPNQFDSIDPNKFVNAVQQQFQKALTDFGNKVETLPPEIQGPLKELSQQYLNDGKFDDAKLKQLADKLGKTKDEAAKMVKDAAETAKKELEEKEDNKKNPCPANSKEPQCLDRCSTRYIAELSAAGKAASKTGATQKVVACIIDHKDKDPVAKAIDRVERACNTDFETAWKAAGCALKPTEVPDPKELAKIAEENEKVPEGVTDWDTSINSVGEKACRDAIKELEKEVKESKGMAKESKATGADMAQCTFKGAVDCFQDGPGSQKYTCKPKGDAGKNKPPGNENQIKDNTTTPPGLNGNMPSMPSGPGSPSSPGGPSSPQPKEEACPAGYSRQGAQQQTQTKDNEGFFSSLGGVFGGSNSKRSSGKCVKDEPKKDATKPQCLIVASSEKIKAGQTVTVRWRTANAENVDIEGIGEDVSKNSQKSLSPATTTVYKLVATGKGDSENKKECEVTVEVEGTTSTAVGPSGVAPPKLSCRPTTIEKGKGAVIKWECPTKITSSSGVGIDTNAKPVGEVSVQPAYNTEYSVLCLDADEKEVGKNTCSVSVGDPKYDIIVSPSSADRGDRVRITWASLFMKSCRVYGPRGFDYTREQGVVITEPFALDTERVPNRQLRAAVYTIECESQFGGRISKDVKVEFSGE